MTTTRLVRIWNWAKRAAARLLVAWDKPRNRAFAEAIGDGAQLLEDESFNLLVSTGLDQATGDALDQWGAYVGEQRGALSDTEYRQFISARMLVNRSNGTIDELIEILDVATAPNNDVFHLDNFPAGFYLVVERAQFLTDEAFRRVAQLMEDARPGGRHMSVIESVTGGFGFADDDTASGYGVGEFSRLLQVI